MCDYKSAVIGFDPGAKMRMVKNEGYVVDFVCGEQSTTTPIRNTPEGAWCTAWSVLSGRTEMDGDEVRLVPKHTDEQYVKSFYPRAECFAFGGVVGAPLKYTIVESPETHIELTAFACHALPALGKGEGTI